MPTFNRFVISAALFFAIPPLVVACDDEEDEDSPANDGAVDGSSGSTSNPGGSGGTPSVASTQPCGTDTGTGCAPDSQRVDLYTPTFSNPLNVTNPFFPISQLESVVFAGLVDGEPFRTETTLLPETKTIVWNGQEVETLVSQYMAFSGGRIEEIAEDWYAQDDRGAVWYFGEDVADYDENGVIFTHEGTWLVGVDDAPLSMIMPANPQVGQVYRAENIHPIAWEEVTVQSVDVTVDGPSGPVSGAMVGSELHMEGTRQEKIFAPGYGEFSTGSLATNDLEALALAIPADALSGPRPPELDTLAASTAAIFGAAELADWTAASAALETLTGAWEGYAAGQVPPRVEAVMVDAVESLGDAVEAESADEARQEAIEVARVTYDLRLRHQPPIEINRVRFDLWLAQVLVDAEAGEAGAIRGDAATLDLVWKRIAHAYTEAAAADISSQLGELRAAAAGDAIDLAATTAEGLRATFAEGGWQ
jgi:hypothetical protein